MSNSLLIFAKTNNVNGCKRYISSNDHRIEVNRKEFRFHNSGYTALMHACENGYLEMTSLLLERKEIDVNIQSDHGHTALIRASRNGHVEIVELLLQQNSINLKLFNKYKNTALIRACRNGHFKIVELLLRHGDTECLNFKDFEGCTALMHSCELGYTPIVELLLAQPRIDVNAADYGGNTALIKAAFSDKYAIVQMILESPMPTNAIARNHENYAAIHYAYAFGFTDIEILLRESELMDSLPAIEKELANKDTIIDALRQKIDSIKLEQAELNTAYEQVANLSEELLSKDMIITVLQESKGGNEVIFQLNAEIKRLKDKVEVETALNRNTMISEIEDAPENAPNSLIGRRAALIRDKENLRANILLFNNDVNEILCPICLATIKTHAGACGHKYCEECITRCRNERGNCYQCNGNVGQVRRVYD